MFLETISLPSDEGGGPAFGGWICAKVAATIVNWLNYLLIPDKILDNNLHLSQQISIHYFLTRLESTWMQFYKYTAQNQTGTNQLDIPLFQFMDKSAHEIRINRVF